MTDISSNARQGSAAELLSTMMSPSRVTFYFAALELRLRNSFTEDALSLAGPGVRRLVPQIVLRLSGIDIQPERHACQLTDTPGHPLDSPHVSTPPSFCLLLPPGLKRP